MAIGPVVISLPRLFFLISLIVAIFAANRLEKRTGKHIEAALWLSLLVGLLVARAAYVLTHLQDFQDQPWQALFLWQDGYLPVAGILAALAVMLGHAHRADYPIRTALLPLLIGLVVWGGFGWVQQALRDATSKPLPALAVEDLQGRTTMLDSFQGQPVVMNLWASWCPPCRREMPVLASAQEREPGVHFLFVNQGEGPGTIEQYLTSEQLVLQNVLLDLGSQVGRHFHSAGLPTTLFFDANGQLIDTHMGELSRARLGDYVRALKAQEK